MIPTTCALWSVCAVPILAWGYYGQPSAVLWKDQLFVALTGSHVYRGAFTPAPKRVRDPIEFLNPGQSRTTQAKVDIRDDRLLVHKGGAGEYYIFPMTVLPLLEVSEFGATVRAARGYHDLLSLDGLYAGQAAELLFPDHREADVPVTGRTDDFPEATYIRERARYSLQIAGPKSVRLFHAHKDKLFVAVEPDYLCNWYRDEKGHVAKNLPKPPDRELRTGKLPADFTEHFTAYHAGGCDYLVTPNGKVYMCVPKGKVEVEVTKVWDDPKRRIVGVVQDQASDAVCGWGFVTTSAKPERFYVKFCPKPVAVAYMRTVPLWSDRSDAYLESYECARAFRKAAKK